MAAPGPAARKLGADRSKYASRLSTFGAVSAVALAVLVADFLVFGGPDGSVGDSGGWSIEVALCACLVLAAVPLHRLASRRRAAAKEAPGPSADMRRSADAPAECAGTIAGPRSSGGGRGDRAHSMSGGIPAAQQSAAVSKLNLAIDVAAKQGDLAAAEKLLLSFEAKGGKAATVSYNLVIRACAKMSDITLCERWLKRMEAAGVEMTVCTCNTVMDACAKAGAAEACEAWLRRIIERGMDPNVISYATVIYAHARRGDVGRAEAWLQRMLVAGIQPDAVAYNSLIHAFSVKGDIAGASRWLLEMRRLSLETSVATYTCVIDACAKAGNADAAEQWLQDMLSDGVQPNVVTYCAVIDACAKAGNLQRAEQMHERMVDAGIEPNAHSFTAVINACSKQAGPESGKMAERWLDKSLKMGVVCDAAIFSSAIDACGKSGDAERAMRVFRRMQAAGHKPTIIAFAALARPFAYRGDWVKVESIASTMASEGVRSNEYFLYAQLLSYAVARPRQSERAEERFSEALRMGVLVNDHVVNVLARALGKPRCEQLLADLCPNRNNARAKLHSNAGSGRGGRPLREGRHARSTSDGSS